MDKIQQLEILLHDMLKPSGTVLGCAVASRQSQGDLLYEINMGEIEPSLLATVMSSVLLIGEKLGHELGGEELGYTLIGLANSSVLVIPCGEALALLVFLKETVQGEAAIHAACATAGKIRELLA